MKAILVHIQSFVFTVFFFFNLKNNHIFEPYWLTSYKIGFPSQKLPNIFECVVNIWEVGDHRPRREKDLKENPEDEEGLLKLLPHIHPNHP